MKILKICLLFLAIFVMIKLNEADKKEDLIGMIQKLGENAFDDKVHPYADSTKYIHNESTVDELKRALTNFKNAVTKNKTADLPDKYEDTKTLVEKFNLDKTPQEIARIKRQDDDDESIESAIKLAMECLQHLREGSPERIMLEKIIGELQEAIQGNEGQKLIALVSLTKFLDNNPKCRASTTTSTTSTPADNDDDFLEWLIEYFFSDW